MSLPLHDALRQCRRHAEVPAKAQVDLPASFDVTHVLAPDDALVRTGDQVLRTFTAEVLGETVFDRPLIDVLNRLERYGSWASGIGRVGAACATR